MATVPVHKYSTEANGGNQDGVHCPVCKKIQVLLLIISILFEWKRIHNEKLRDLHSSRNVIRAAK